MSLPRFAALLSAVVFALTLALPARASLFEQALQLGPGHGYVAVPDAPALNFTNGFTFEAWVSVADSGSCSSIAGKDYLTAYWVGVCGTTLRTYIKGGSSSFNSGTIPANQWTHIAVTYDGTTRRHYINGVQTGTKADTPPMTTSTSEFRIGSDVQWEFTATGYIDEARLWNVARTAAELKETMFSSLGQSLPGLVAVYHFDGNARDIIGANNGTSMLASAFAAPTTPIVSFNQSLALGPGHGYVSTPDSPALDFTTGFTFEAWVSIAEGSCSSIAGKGWTEAFWIGVCGRTLRSYIKGESSLFDSGLIVPNQWTHVAVTYDGIIRRHYINGVLTGEQVDAAPMTTNSSAFRIGSDVSYPNTPTGYIDEVRLWNVARSPAQLLSTLYTQLYQVQPGLVAAYHFDGNAADLTGAHNGTVNLAAAFGTAATTILSGANDVVEFYNTNLDNYFITANRIEAAAIDGGSAGPGWIRTGNRFASGGSKLVCRFYGSITPGPNSHFYTVSQDECDGLVALQGSTPNTQPRWNFESLDFASTPTLGGGCAAGSVPIYRAYNDSFARHIDSNHRITSNLAAIAEVVNRGWINEGIVMCAAP